MKDDHTANSHSSPIHFSLKVWENVLFELGSETSNRAPIRSGTLSSHPHSPFGIFLGLAHSPRPSFSARCSQNNRSSEHVGTTVEGRSQSLRTTASRTAWTFAFRSRSPRRTGWICRQRPHFLHWSLRLRKRKKSSTVKDVYNNRSLPCLLACPLPSPSPPFLPPPSLPPCLPTSLFPSLPACLPPSLPACLPPSFPPCPPPSFPPRLPPTFPPCLPAYLPACLPACIPPSLPSCLPPFLPASLPVPLPPPFLPPTSLPSCLPPCFLLSLPTCLPPLPSCLLPCLLSSFPSSLFPSLLTSLPTYIYAYIHRWCSTYSSKSRLSANLRCQMPADDNWKYIESWQH